MRFALKRSIYIMPAIMAGMMLFSCHRGKNLSPEEAMKAIKVLNSDLINLSDGISENLAFGGLKFLLEEPTSPLSTQNGLVGKWLNDTIISLIPFTGKYTWIENTFKRISESDIIDITFQIPGTTDSADFTVTDFECRRMISSLCFPMEIKAIMLNHDEEILYISGSSEFIEDLPGKIEFKIRGEEFEGSVQVERTRQEDRGTLDIELEFRVNGFDIIKGNIHAQIGYSGNQVFFRSYEPDIRVFDVKIAGKLYYGKVDPTSKDYVKSFNDNCQIGFYDSGSDKKIGNFGIGELKNGELLGWVIYLSDGKPLFLEDQLLVVEKLLNFKLQNKVSQ